MPTTRSLLTFLALSPFTLVACGSSPERGDARFAGMSAAERDNEIGGATGNAAVVPYFVVLGADLDNASNPDCPRREDGDGVVTFIAGNCTTADGTAYDGRIVARNALLFSDLLDPQVDPTKPMSIELEQFRAGPLTVDGALTQSLATPEDGDQYTTLVTYELTTDEGSASVEMAADCVRTDGVSDCTTSGFIDGTSGSYAFDGDLGIGAESAAGTLELRGADTLRVDFDAAVDGCAPYTIDGAAAGEFCFAEPTPEPTALEFTGTGTGCGPVGTAFEHEASTWVRGDANIVTFTLDDGASLETQPLEHVSYDEVNDEHVWQTIFQTDIPCGDNLTYKFAAYDTEGNSICFAWGANPQPYEAEGCEVW